VFLVRQLAVATYMGVGRIFSRWGGDSGFFQWQPKKFFRWPKSCEISFFPLETKKTTFFAKNLIGKCTILKNPLLPNSGAHAHLTVM